MRFFHGVCTPQIATGGLVIHQPEFLGHLATPARMDISPIRLGFGQQKLVSIVYMIWKLPENGGSPVVTMGFKTEFNTDMIFFE